MGMSDCIKCWDTPCTCGYQYESWSIDKLHREIRIMQDIVLKKMEEEYDNDQIDGESGEGS